ncbi:MULTISPECIES: hypothetical protein [unclassified Halomonas]|uniref:hypothetical protein n=1 Tax=unclassified Halomonas TaxID=2609666 RepID=UPI00131E0009|nr:MULTISPECIES: hypothetical protein [unclassified Halomonas]
MNKYQTKRLWDEDGIPHNAYRLLSSAEYGSAVEFAEKNDWQIVIKPINGAGGKNVFTGIKNEQDLSKFWRVLEKKKNSKVRNILVERRFIGDDFRFFVVAGRVQGVLERVRPNIVGDGRRTVGELINAKRQTRLLNPDLAARPIKEDSVVEHQLKAHKVDRESVLPEGLKIVLRGNANISTGGEHRDRTDEIPESIKALVERAVASLPNATTSAVDVLAKDITDGVNLNEESIVLNEIEADAAMCMHHFPMHGTPRNLARRILLESYPELDDGSVGSPYSHDFDENEKLSKELISCIKSFEPGFIK